MTISLNVTKLNKPVACVWFGLLWKLNIILTQLLLKEGSHENGIHDLDGI